MHETSPSRHRTPRRRRAALGLVVALALALAAAACGSDDATSTADGGSTTTADSAETTTTTAPAALPTEVQDEVQGILDASLEPGAIAWDCCGADAPPTGAALAVRIPGHADLLVSSGSDLTGAEFDPTAPFLTGTLATSIVRTIAIQLVEEGELDPEATLDEFVAGLTGAEEITVQMLIDGTDGLGDFDGIDARNIIADYERVWTLDEVLATFEGRPPASPPGERWAAGLVGSAALASILEQTTGTSFSDLVRERVTEPLALDETAVDDGVELPAGFQSGVFVLDGTIIETSDVPATSYFTFNTATSSVVSTLPDLLDLLDAWMEGDLFADGRQPIPDDFPSERTAEAGDLIAALSVPVNGYCPCEPVGAGNTTASIGRGPNAPGSDLWLIEYPDGISVGLHYNSNEEVDKAALRDVADQAHEAAATAR